MAETSEQLKFTADELGATKVVLGETKFLVKEHVATEAKLFSQADLLKTNLTQSLDDITKLHGKIERKSKLEAHNKTTSLIFQSSLSERLALLEKRLVEFQTQQNKSFGSLHASITGFMKQKSVDFSLLVDQVTSSLQSITMHTQELNTHISAATVSRDQKLTKYQEDENLQANSLVQTLSQFSKETTGILDHLHVQMSSHATKLKDSAIEVDTAITEHSSCFSESLLKQVVDINAFAGELKENQKSQRINLDEARSIISESQVAFAEENNKQMSIMFASMQQMMTDYQANQNMRLKNWVNAVDNKIVETTKEIASSEKQMEFMTANLLKQNNAIKEHYLTGLSDISQKINTDASEFYQQVNSLQDGMQALKSQVIAPSVIALTDSVTSCAEKFVQEVKEDGLAIHEQSNCQLNVISTIDTQFGAFKHEHVTDLESLSLRTDEVGAAWVDDLKFSQDTQRNHMEEYGAILTEMSGSLNNFVSSDLKIDVSTGETPLKKDVHYPQKLVKTSPHEELLRKFRMNPVQELDVEQDSILTRRGVLKIPLSYALDTDEENATRPIPLESTKSSRGRCLKAPLGPIDLNLIN